MNFHTHVDESGTFGWDHSPVNNRVTLATGTAGGNGLWIARGFTVKGAAVVLFDGSPDAHELGEELGASQAP